MGMTYDNIPKFNSDILANTLSNFENTIDVRYVYVRRIPACTSERITLTTIRPATVGAAVLLS